MSKINITVNKDTISKTCSIICAVIFFILSFLVGFNNYVTFILGILLLGVILLQSYRSIKGSNFYVLGIILIPIISYGLILSLSLFSSYLYSVVTRIFIPLNFILFLGVGFLSKNIKNFNFRLIFVAVFSSLSIICLINLIVTTVYYGPFYGLIIPHYYSYFDGNPARVEVSGTAYALCGFKVKEVPIEYYLTYPFLLLTSIFFYLFGNRRNKRSIILVSTFTSIAVISLLFVISKISALLIIPYLLFIVFISLVIIFKKLYSKPLKIVLFCLTGLFILFAIFFFINSQYILTEFRDVIASNRLTNYVFNTNHYSDNARLILNDAFSFDKMIGFPPYDDPRDYLKRCLISNNILINQFMYGGVFGFVFFLIIITLFIYIFIETKKKPLEDKINKYGPLLFVISFFVLSMITEQNSYDVYDTDKIFASYLSPFFMISLFIIGHYFHLINVKENKDEK